MNNRYEDFYDKNDLSRLVENTEIGQTYTMELRVTSTCPNDVEIGFAGQGGWFTTTVNANLRDSKITVTDTWRGSHFGHVGHIRLENRMACGSSTITIHQIKLVKGSGNCFVAKIGIYLCFSRQFL